MSLDIRDGFAGRTIFITGGTGFVGKVALFKILKEFPEIKTVYLLMRGKRSRKLKRYLKPQERLELEVFGSPCFEPLRKVIGEAKWKELCAKVKPMNGDITEDHIGLSEKDRATLANEAQMIIHLAATVNFNERLDLAVQMNTLGGLRVLALAKTCKHLEAMVHVSTCYVNFQRQGKENINEERIYPLSFDPEAMCKHILGLNEVEVPRESKRLLKDLHFPNTYTFTKNMGEQLINRYKANVPLVVVRPSIVGCSYYEPIPGWVDALTAAGGLILTGSLGVVRELVCRKDLTADIIPVDFVVNVILKALFKTQQYYKGRHPLITAAQDVSASASSSDVKGASAMTVPLTSVKAGGEGGVAVNTPTAVTLNRTSTAAPERPSSTSAGEANPAGELPFIYQVATSGTEHHVTWGRLSNALEDYMKTAKRHPKALSQCHVTLTDSDTYYWLRYHVLRLGPYQALRLVARLPQPLGSPKMQKDVEKLGRAVRRADLLNREFRDFVLAEWFFACDNTVSLDEGLNERSKKAFPFDQYAINWYAYTRLYAYGIFKHIVGDTGKYACPTLPPTSTELFMKASSL